MICSRLDSADAIAKELLTAGLVEGRNLVGGKWLYYYTFGATVCVVCVDWYVL